jgi:3-dehydroquinate dehydratase / shikimate dehydrogenase
MASVFGRDRICAVVAADTAPAMLTQLGHAFESASLLELRLDWLLNIHEIRRFLAMVGVIRATLPGFSEATLIATCRRRGAGGKFSGGIVDQMRILKAAVDAGCSWVDLEIESASQLRRFELESLLGRAQWLVSYHNFRSTPKTLSSVVQRLSTAGGDAIKLAALARSFRDLSRLLELPSRSELVVVPMGDSALPGRILALKRGSGLAYAALENATAPGQISFDEMRGLYRADRVNAKTRVHGVIGDPIGHSLSPHMHNAGFDAAGINAVYLPFLVKDLRDFLGSVASLGIEGFSVTLPHKTRIMRYLDDCDPVAKEIGAVNTVAINRKGKLRGYNTDYLGIIRALESHMTLSKSRALIFGAGGAARSTAFALACKGAVVRICARRQSEARKLAELVKGQPVPRSALRREKFDLIVNATPVGMHPRADHTPLAADELNASVVFDLVYRPRRTKLLEIAEGRGIRTVSGVEMFLAQGLAQWEIWMGKKPPVQAMRRAVETALESEERAEDAL